MAPSDGKEPLSEVFGETLNYTALTVGELLAASSTANANRTALVCLHQPASLFRELAGGDDAEHEPATSSQVEHMLRLSHAKALLVWDSQMALALARYMPEVIKQIDLKIIALPGGVPGWQNFQDLASESQRDNIRSQTIGTDEAALVIFTSGTTALPKGCIQSHENLMAGAEANRKITTMDENSVVCGHMSLSHIAGNNYALACWAVGGTLVLPAESFEATSTLQAISIEKCTHVQMTPNWMYKLLRHPSLATTDLRSMRTGFKLNAVTNRFVAVGYVAPGARVRVCAPGNKAPLPRGTAGELHQGGAQVIEQYLDRAREAFYTDCFGSWLITGDRAVMDPDGKIWILGRYKDVIIRGGLNLSPASQVVGRKDTAMGEVPVAIVSSIEENVSTETLRQAVVDKHGLHYAPESIIRLELLGMKEFPMTSTGKVCKPDLVAALGQYLASQTISD
ncbi:hypothetical protein G7Y79_00010g027630 [Physcia stellaris]|nr:hypothetical protein G7Y79_00010g027630 [Physcia stellaris]